MTFGGWGEPPIPGNVSDIADWFRDFEKDHQKVPDWFYPFLDILMEQNDKVEISTGRYRKCLAPYYEREPISISAAANPSWIRYENAPYIPHNFVAIGDAVLQPNPTYG